MSYSEQQMPSGFKKTDVGVIPNDWNVEKFGSIVQPSNSRVNPAVSGGGHLCIELEHIAQNKGTILGSTKTTLNSSIKNNFKEQSVLFGKLRSYLRKYWFATKEGVCSTEIWVFNAVDNPKVTPKFLYQIVQLESFIELASEGYGTHFRNAFALGQLAETAQGEGITLSTVHTMKGLEKDIVFLIGMVEGVFPDYRAKTAQEIEEEKNSAFVAVTRAKRWLYITYPQKRTMPWGDIKFQSPSRFIRDL